MRYLIFWSRRQVHGCLPTTAPPLTRLLRLHKLLSTLESEYAVFANEPNLVAPGGGTCVDYGLLRRTPCVHHRLPATSPPPTSTLTQEAPGAVAPPLSTATPPRVAVCLVGQLPTLRMTADSLRSRLLDTSGADAFVIATTDSNAAPNATERSWVAQLGPRVVHALVGTEEDVLDERLLVRVAKAPLQTQMLLHFQASVASHLPPKQASRCVTRRRESRPLRCLAPPVRPPWLSLAYPADSRPLVRCAHSSVWPHKVAAQLLHAHACHAAVSAYEAARGALYDVYARVRLDMALFEPIPDAFFAPMHHTDPYLAVVPTGSDQGGLNDRMLVGGFGAFAADAARWRALVENSLKLATPWLPETLHQSNLRAAGVTVSEPGRAAPPEGPQPSPPPLS